MIWPRSKRVRSLEAEIVKLKAHLAWLQVVNDVDKHNRIAAVVDMSKLVHESGLRAEAALEEVAVLRAANQVLWAQVVRDKEVIDGSFEAGVRARVAEFEGAAA